MPELITSSDLRPKQGQNLAAYSSAVGAVVGTLGSGGSLPTGWEMAQQPAGISYDIVRTGTDYNGNTYFDFRIYGLTTTNRPLLRFTPAFAMQLGQFYCGSCYLSHVGGSTQVNVSIYSGGPGTINLYQSGELLLSKTHKRYAFTWMPASGTSHSPWIDFSFVTLNIQCDATIRISAIQLETGIAPTKFISTSGTAIAGNYDLVGESQAANAELSDITSTTSTNLIKYSNAFSSGDWTDSSARMAIIPNTTTAPDGTMTASKIVPTFTYSTYKLEKYNLITISPGQSYTLSIHAKAAGYDRIYLWRGIDGGGCAFDLFNGTTIGGNSLIIPTIVNLGGGWYRCSVTYKFSFSFISQPTVMSFRYYIVEPSKTNVNTWTVACDGTSGIYFWGAQLNRGTSAQAYIETTTTQRFGFDSYGDLIGYPQDITPLPAPSLNLDFTVPVLDSRITYTRNDSVATRINSRGYIESVGVNVPRFDYDPVTLKCKGLLIEDSSTNLYLNSWMNTTTSWIGSNSSTLSVSNPGTLPLGVSNCIKNTLTTIHGSTYQQFTLSTNVTYTISFWVYIPTQSGTTNASISSYYVDTDTGGNWVTISTVSITERDVWVKKSLTFTTNATYPITIAAVGLANSTIGNYSYACMGQLEQRLFASSFIPTTTVAITRDSDQPSFTLSNWNIGTFHMKTTQGLYSSQPQPLLRSNNNIEFITVRSNTKVGTWNFINEVNTTNNSIDVRNGINFAVSYNNQGIITSLNGISDQTNEGVSNGGFFTVSTNMLLWYSRNHSTIIKSLAYYQSKLPVTILNSLTGGTSTAIGAGSVPTVSGEVTDMRPLGQNLIRNSNFSGLTSTETTSLPTNWSWNHTNPTLGITAYSKLGTYQGQLGTFIRYTGTATGSNEFALINSSNIESLQVAWISRNSQFTLSSKLALVSGTIPRNLELLIASRTISGTMVAASQNYLSLSSTLTNYSHTSPENFFNQPEVAQVAIKFRMIVTTNDIFDFTIFLADPQLNYGATVLPYTPTGPNENSYGKLSSAVTNIKSEATDLATHKNNLSSGYNQTSFKAGTSTTTNNVITTRYPLPDPFGNYYALTATPTGLGNSTIYMPVYGSWQRNKTYTKAIYAKRGSGAICQIVFEEWLTGVGTTYFSLHNMTITGSNYGKACFQNIGNGWYRLINRFTIPITSDISLWSSNYYIGNYGAGAPSSDVHVYGPTLHESPEIANVNVWARVGDAANQISWTSTGTITFNGAQTANSGLQITSNLAKGPVSYLVSINVTVTSGSVRIGVGGTYSPYITSTGSYTYALDSLTDNDTFAIVESGSTFVGSVSMVSVSVINGPHNAAINYSDFGSTSNIRLGKTNAFSDDMNSSISSTLTITPELIAQILLSGNISNTPFFDRSILTAAILLASQLYNEASFIDKDLTTAIILLAAFSSDVLIIDPNLVTEILLADLAGTGAITNILGSLLETAIKLNSDISSSSLITPNLTNTIILSSSIVNEAVLSNPKLLNLIIYLYENYELTGINTNKIDINGVIINFEFNGIASAEFILPQTTSSININNNNTNFDVTGYATMSFTQELE